MIKLNKLILLILFLLINGCTNKKENKISNISLDGVSIDKGTYSVLIDESKLSWIGKEISTKIHTGTLDLSTGVVRVDSDNSISGSIGINMSTLTVTDLQGRAKEMLERHLRSADFFEVENYPEAKFSFKSKPFSKLENPISFEGELIIKGISNPILFNASLLEISPLLKSSANLSFDRSKYNVRFRSGSFFQNLGDKLILDDIDIEITLVSKKQ